MSGLRACRYVQRSCSRSLPVRLLPPGGAIGISNTLRRYTAAASTSLSSTPIITTTPTTKLTTPTRERTCLTLFTPAAGQRRTFTTSFPAFSEAPPPPGAADEPIKTYSYDAIKSLATAPTAPADIIIVDVREPDEFADGHIPSARNLPITTRPDGLHLSSKEFQDTFGWEKPDLGSPTELIFYCRAGVRSKVAVGIARQCGYTNVAEYPGSWLDWVENEEKKKKKEQS